MPYQSYQPFSSTRPTGNRPHKPLIHTLDDYSLLNIFSLSRPEILDENEVDDSRFSEVGEWIRERWWCRLVQVCRRWRYIVLESASHLRLSLVCVRGTPVADMLAHSPPLPVIIDHFDRYHEITAEDAEGIILALQHRDRVRRIRLRKFVSILPKLINFLDGEFPILEYLLIESQELQWPLFEHKMSLPETFRAPHLRHLLLTSLDIPIGSPLLTTMGSLVTLSLSSIPRSAYFDPNALLQRVSLLPQLEMLGIYFETHFPSNIERQLLHTPIMMRVTFPNLRWLGFKGGSAYLEALLPQVTTPLLEKLQVYFFAQLTYSIPHLQQFVSTAENLRHNTITLAFHSQCVDVMAYPHEGARMYTLSLSLNARSLDWQLSSTIQVSHSLRTVFSAVEHLSLKYDGPTASSWGTELDHTRWRELLGLFINVKTLFVDDRLVGQLSPVVHPGTGESPMELLPELQELSCPVMPTSVNAFTSFIDARQKAGRPVTMIYRRETRPGAWRNCSSITWATHTRTNFHSLPQSRTI
jgi:hypothetical protein